MNLRQYARKHITGGITWWVMPYTTLRHQAISDEFDAIVPREQRGVVEQSFVAIEGYVVDVEFAETLTPQEKMFLEYWRTRPLSTPDRWFAFSMLTQAEVANAFWAAFGATRDTLTESVEADDARPS